MHVLLEVWIFGGQVAEVRGFVLVAVPGVHGLIQSHDERALISQRRGEGNVSVGQAQTKYRKQTVTGLRWTLTWGAGVHGS